MGKYVLATTMDKYVSKSSGHNQNKITIYEKINNGGDFFQYKESLSHSKVKCLVELSHGAFASGGNDHNLIIWYPSTMPSAF